MKKNIKNIILLTFAAVICVTNFVGCNNNVKTQADSEKYLGENIEDIQYFLLQVQVLLEIQCRIMKRVLSIYSI